MHNKTDIGRASPNKFGPLTLGMASPQKGQLADRLDRLSYAKSQNRVTRGLACTVLLGLAALSAPYTIAGAEPADSPVIEAKFDNKSVYRFSNVEKWTGDGTLKLQSAGTYEIIEQNDVLSAYQILDRGKTRQQVPVNLTSDGEYELTLQNGEVVSFIPPEIPVPPKPPVPPHGKDVRHVKIVTNLEGLEAETELEVLSALKGLESLEGLEGLEGLLALEGLSGLEGLSALEGLAGLEGLSALSSLSELSSLADISDLNIMKLVDGQDFKVVIKSDDFVWENDGTLSKAELNERIPEILANLGDERKIRILKSGEGQRVFNVSPNGEFELETEVISGDEIRVLNFDNNIDAASVEIAKQELERAEEILRTMINDGDVSSELERALDEISKAKSHLDSKN